MRPQIVSVGPLVAASAQSIMLSATVAAAGPLTLNGSTVSNSVATLDKPRRVTISSSGNDSALLFVLQGTNWSGAKITETLLGSNAGIVTSILDYLTLVSATATGAAAGTVSIGTSSIAGSPWVRLDDWSPTGVAVQYNPSGAITCTVQSTLDDPNDPTNAVSAPSVVWINSSDANAVSASTAIQTNYAFNPRYVRVVLTNASTTGSATLTVLQPSVTP